MRRRRGWSDFSTEEKLEALRADVNIALDLAEEFKKRLDTLEAKVRRMRE